MSDAPDSSSYDAIRADLQRAFEACIGLRAMLTDLSSPIEALPIHQRDIFIQDLRRFHKSARDGLNHTAMLVGYTQGLPARTAFRDQNAPLLAGRVASDDPQEHLEAIDRSVEVVARALQPLTWRDNFTPLPDVPKRPGPVIVARNARRHLCGLAYHLTYALCRAFALSGDMEREAQAQAWIVHFSEGMAQKGGSAEE